VCSLHVLVNLSTSHNITNYCEKATQFTQVNLALHPSGVAKSSTSFGWGKGGKVTSAGWQVTLCDLIWHVISRSGVVISITNCYIRFTLLYFTYLLVGIATCKRLSSRLLHNKFEFELCGRNFKGVNSTSRTVLEVYTVSLNALSFVCCVRSSTTVTTSNRRRQASVATTTDLRATLSRQIA